MSGRSRSGDTLTEACPECARATPHSVRLELRTESDKPQNAAFSREPYRVATCTACGHTTALRMNNA